MREEPSGGLRIVTAPQTALTPEQREAVQELQESCFSDVPYDELMDDFVAEAAAKVLAYQGKTLVGCVSVFVRPVVYAGVAVRLGGFGGTCTRADLRGHGIGTAVSQAAMRMLYDENCDIAFLAVDPAKGTDRFYARFGFVLLGRPFTFINAHGVTKSPTAGDTGMVAPVHTPELSDQVLAGPELLHLGPEPGYW